jgi:predicted metal-dependent hydrolase
VGPAGIEVVAPLRMRAADIMAFVEHNRAWIDARLGAVQRVLAAHPGSGQLIDGSAILYRGRPARLRVRPGARPQVHEGGDLEVTVPASLTGADQEAVVERLLRRWLAWAAQNDALAYVQRHGRPHGLVPAGVRIKQHKHLWGSCTAKGVVNLNWRLILAPPAVFEYVVVHELSHLRQPHHQVAFWRLVRQILPGFEEQRRWLRTNGHLLTLRPGEGP